VTDNPDRLLTKPYATVLVLAFLGFSIEQLIRPVLPLIVIARGGYIVLVGIVSAVPALPSLLSRPLIGQLVDGPWHAALLRLGTVLVSVAPLGLLLPGLAFLGPARFLHGFGWALYSVSTHALMAMQAPTQRRGEASGYFLAMPALATLIAPGIAITAYVAGGEVVPVLMATGLGILATAVALRLVIPAKRTGVPSPGLGDNRPRSRGLVERSAIPATFMITTFMAAHSLFAVFPPVYALQVGAPVESLALYYPIYGLVLLVGQVTMGRVSDRLGRGATIRLGCSFAVVGLAVAAAGDGLPQLLLGAVSYAVGVAFVSPTVSALTIDRSPPNRMGSSMATYSLGYQLATSGSSLVWGALISAGGFSLAFVSAIGLQLCTVFASFLYARRRAGTAEV
jgi:MFS family permease